MRCWKAEVETGRAARKLGGKCRGKGGKREQIPKFTCRNGRNPWLAAKLCVSVEELPAELVKKQLLEAERTE